MKRTNNFTLAALAALCLAGCTQDDERTAAGLPMTGTPMRVVAHVDAPMTREAMTTNDLTRYYFRVTDADGGTDEYNYFTTMKLTNGQWTGDKEMTWQSTFPKVSALEQKGVNWSETDYTDGKDVSVETNQSTRDGLLKSDLLYMKPKTITATDLDAEGNIKVNLAHRFAKLKVVVNVTGTMKNPITALTIGGTQTTATFIPETDELTLSGDATNITAYYDPSASSISDEAPGCTATYECILLPQTVEASTLKITATTTTDQKNKGYLHSAPLTLKGNYEYTLRLEMKANGSMSTSGSVDVGGWGEGTGTEDGGELEEGAIISKENGKTTYTVSTARGLLEWAKAAAQSPNFINLTLTEDIDMKGKTWPDISDYYDGIIDGGGYTIKNLTITKGTGKGNGLIAGSATNCIIKDLTLLNPSITSDHNGGFLIGETANYCTIENCHVIGGTDNDGDGIIEALAYYADNSSFIACSVTSSDAGLIDEVQFDKCVITACYVTGGKLVYREISGTPTYTASYYQESADGGITAAGNSSAVTSWAEAAEQMNAQLSDKKYEWVVNTGSDADDRPLVIKPQTTD